MRSRLFGGHKSGVMNAWRLASLSSCALRLLNTSTLWRWVCRQPSWPNVSSAPSPQSQFLQCLRTSACHCHVFGRWFMFLAAYAAMYGVFPFVYSFYPTGKSSGIAYRHHYPSKHAIWPLLQNNRFFIIVITNYINLWTLRFHNITLFHQLNGSVMWRRVWEVVAFLVTASLHIYCCESTGERILKIDQQLAKSWPSVLHFGLTDGVHARGSKGWFTGTSLRYWVKYSLLNSAFCNMLYSAEYVSKIKARIKISTSACFRIALLHAFGSGTGTRMR